MGILRAMTERHTCSLLLLIGLLTLSGCAGVPDARVASAGDQVYKIVTAEFAESAKADVQTSSRMGKLYVDVTAHLLEMHAPDDQGPFIEGDYQTKEGLERVVKMRVALLFRAIFRQFDDPQLGAVSVACRHGVRVTDTKVFFSLITVEGEQRDEPVTLFKASISGGKARKTDWEKISLSEVEQLWYEEENRIPELEITRGQ